ncbi:MAG: phosphatidate cytidylyltransferase [Desulfuromonadales bacterium]|nr:phosphatidate cytidylyltransferase [Desulfuromonadales bacterium]
MKQRILTGLILLPLLVLFIGFASPALFNLLVYAVVLLALVEFFTMGLPAEPVTERYLAIAAGTLLTPFLVVADEAVKMAALTLLFIFLAIFFLLRFRDLQTVVQRLGMITLGIFYLPLLLSYLPLLRELPAGREWIFTVLLLVMAGDTAAYFIGVRFGRRKLYPAISPNKSVEGAMGGLLGSLGGAVLAKIAFFPALRLFDCLLLGLAAGVVAQLGDLFESMLKRSFGVKDSGRLIPGHGGILDRLDSLLFAFPLVYFYALWIFRF